MFARLAAISGAGAAPTDGVSFFRDHVLPDLRGYDGFHDAMVLLPREGGDRLVLSPWDTEENLRRAEATAAPHRTSAARAALGPETQRDVRIYEGVRADAREKKPQRSGERLDVADVGARVEPHAHSGPARRLRGAATTLSLDGLPVADLAAGTSPFGRPAAH